MTTVVELQPVTRVFQLLGLSVTQFFTPKDHPLHRVIKCYSLLLIATRFALFSYILMKYKIPIGSDKITFTIYASVFFSAYLREASILVEAFTKGHQEVTFMENFTGIDNIFMLHFNIDMKPNELRTSANSRLIIWICFIGIESIYHLRMNYETPYFPHELIVKLSIFTASLTYFQIITWTDLIRYRLRIVNRLINELKCEHNEQLKSQKSDKTEHKSNEGNDAIDDTHIFDQFCILCDLYNRLWMQTNRLNERFKFSMVLNIGTDFTYLVAQLYYIAMYFRDFGYSSCNFFAANIATCIVNTFHLSMISRIGQNVADEASTVAYSIHRNKFFRSSSQLNSFVCI